MKNCIFCKIVKGEIPSYKIWENEDCVAILDIYPNTKGMALVLTKKHFPSYAFDMDDKTYCKLMLAGKEVVKLLDKKLGVKRTAMIIEGMGIDHVHHKLYPLHGLKKKFEEIIAKEKKFFKNYEGYITSQLGPKAKEEELKKLAKKIRD